MCTNTNKKLIKKIIFYKLFKKNYKIIILVILYKRLNVILCCTCIFRVIVFIISKS
jgi:hypothetical protein